ncbi:MAG: hypothetical protein RLZZ338_4159 [Cyanobacteriota bacterium]|jgi:membrane protein implicated in regulation of membrane protease activity
MLNFIKSIFTPQESTQPDLPYENQEGIVDQAIYPYRKGRVYYNGTWWPARCPENVTLAPGEVVEVIYIENITVWVRPFSP